MANNVYRRCPKCGLNYITGAQTACTVCVSEAKPYRGKYCRDCGAKSGIYDRCFSCHKLQSLSANEQRDKSGYRTDNGMLGVRSNKVCRICGAATYGQLCGRCYMAIHYSEDADKNN